MLGGTQTVEFYVRTDGDAANQASLQKVLEGQAAYIAESLAAPVLPFAAMQVRVVEIRRIRYDNSSVEFRTGRENTSGVSWKIDKKTKKQMWLRGCVVENWVTMQAHAVPLLQEANTVGVGLQCTTVLVHPTVAVIPQAVQGASGARVSALLPTLRVSLSLCVSPVAAVEGPWLCVNLLAGGVRRRFGQAAAGSSRLTDG